MRVSVKIFAATKTPIGRSDYNFLTTGIWRWPFFLIFGLRFVLLCSRNYIRSLCWWWSALIWVLVSVGTRYRSRVCSCSCMNMGEEHSNCYHL